MRNNVNPIRQQVARSQTHVDHEAMARWPLLKVIADAMRPIGDYAPSTLSNYREACRKFQRFIGYEQSPVNVTDAKIEGFRKWMEADDYEQKTISLNVDALASVVRFADRTLLSSRAVNERKVFADAEILGTLEYMMVNEYFPVNAKIASDETKRQYGMAVARFSRFLGRAARLPDLSDDIFDGWVMEMKEAGLRSKTIKTYADYLRAFWRWAVARGMITALPDVKLELGIDPPRKLKSEIPKKTSKRSRHVRRGSAADAKSAYDFYAPNGILTFLGRYISRKELSPKYEYRLRLYSQKFARFAGSAKVEEVFTEDAFNSFSASLNGSPFTARSVLSDYIVLWNAAADEDLVPYPRMRRLRRPKCPALVIECYRLDDVTRLLRAAKELRGEYSNGVPKRLYWDAAIRLAWDTGLRRGDVMLFRKSSVRADGSLRVVQHKTGRVVQVKLRGSTREALNAIQHDQALAWPTDLTYFGRHFKRIRRIAGLDKGTFKWLRRASGSYVEMEKPGAGCKHLGHSNPQVFERHYDGKLGDHLLPQPPELSLT